jgi:hypothetical protein
MPGDRQLAAQSRRARAAGRGDLTAAGQLQELAGYEHTHASNPGHCQDPAGHGNGIVDAYKTLPETIVRCACFRRRATGHNLSTEEEAARLGYEHTDCSLDHADVHGLLQ